VASRLSLAALVNMQGYQMDFSELVPGLTLAMPDLNFVPPNTAVAAANGTTDPLYVPLGLFGGDNHTNPGDVITESPSPIQNDVTLVNQSAALTHQHLLLDTGAQNTVISTHEAQSLGFDLNNPETTLTVQGVGGTVDVPGYTLHHQLATLRPDFLIISPPKIGSTWLAENLRCHPQVFVPAIKEVRYFSSYFKALDLGWYLGHFTPGADRLKGEASPSYALLPVEGIRLIRRLMPDVRLIFLMRDPVARAWSHAKHTYRFGEANFASCSLSLEAVPDDQWQENFRHEWCLAGGDYLGQLRRWLSVFPKEQVNVGF
jgi:hypothetical protein